MIIDMSILKSKPLVSVVMCSYNSCEYIAEAIKSILGQTYNNFEFIIWDDGSTDSSREIIDSFKDDRIRYFYHDNTGLGMALRLACEQAQGKYIARMDADDISFPDRIEKEVVFLEATPDSVLVSSAVRYIDENGIVTSRSFPYTSDRILKEALLIPSSFIVHPMVMMRNDAYKEAGGYLPIRKSQDVLFWSRLAKQGKFYNIPTPLGKYRILSTSLDHSYNPYSKVMASLLLKMVKDENVKDSDIELYNNIYLYSKQFKQEVYIKHNKYSAPSLEERVYNVIKFVAGEKLSERLVVGTKNVVYKCRHQV